MNKGKKQEGGGKLGNKFLPLESQAMSFSLVQFLVIQHSHSVNAICKYFFKKANFTICCKRPTTT